MFIPKSSSIGLRKPSFQNPLLSSLNRLIDRFQSTENTWLTDAELRDLEAQPGDWGRFFWPGRFGRPFTWYQNDFYAFVAGIETTPDHERRPRVECEPRGVGKSTNGRAAAVYLLAKKIKFYILIVSATDEQAKKHHAAVRKMLENPKLLAHYPHLAPQVSVHRNAAKNWSADRLVTQAGQVIEFVSILGNARGFNTEEGRRLDLILIDDIDDQKDSVDVTEKKLDILGSNILGAGDEYTDVWYLQNLIHRTSICTRLRDNTAGILKNRHFVGPFPLCTTFDYKEVPIEGDTSGATQYQIVDFQPFDPNTSKEYAEQLLNRLGPKIFERECQQNLSIIDDDKDFREYSEIFHVITYSEFTEYYKQFNVPVWNASTLRPQIPLQWNTGLGMDWGTTPDHPSAIIPMSRPNQNVPLSDSLFTPGEVVLPKFPHDVNKPADAVSPGRVIAAEKAHLKKWNITERSIGLRRMSHEASAAMNSFAIDLPDDMKTYYGKWKAARGSGVPQWQQVLEIDYAEQHPFRKYPAGHAKAGEPLMGRPKWYMIVPDEQGSLKCDAAGHLFVSQPVDADGCARLRAEMPVYSHRNQGTKKKIFDDAVDGGRGLIGELVILSPGLTKEEKWTRHVKQNLPELAPEVVAEIKNDEQLSLTLAREQLERDAFDQQQAKRHRQQDGGGIIDYLAEHNDDGGFREL